MLLIGKPLSITENHLFFKQNDRYRGTISSVSREIDFLFSKNNGYFTLFISLHNDLELYYENN